MEVQGNPEVVLVSMPWANVRYPSIQLGILKTLLNNAGIPCLPVSAYLEFCDYLISRGILKGVDDYNKNIDLPLIVEWVFSDKIGPGKIESEKTKTKQKHFNIKKYEQIKTVSPAFMKDLGERIVGMGPKIVGFSTTFQQTVASLALARTIKKLDPRIKILFGGANCEGEQGEAIISCFPFVDAVLHGEAESMFGTFVREVLDGKLDGERPGVSVRRNDGTVILNGNARNKAEVRDWVVPDFDEYFETVEKTSFAESLKTKQSIPFENSRGCWWGQKHQCKFCALNGELTFRSKDEETAWDHLVVLAEKYQKTTFHCVDNIIHHMNYKGFLNRLADGEYDLNLFFEVKSNIGLTDLIRIKKAGVWSIQPGIESLSSPILKIMNKGVTGIQNLRLLKFCAWLDIQVVWNLIYGFPGEPKEEYDRMADLVKSIYHFSPPDVTMLAIEKTSYYYNRPEASGIKIKGPSKIYRALYKINEDALWKMAFLYDYEHLDGRNPDIYVKGLKREVKKWREKANIAKNMLTYYQTGSRITIVDKRIHLNPSVYHLDPMESLIYKLCLDITTIEKIANNEKLLAEGIMKEDVEDFVGELVKSRLLVREGNQVLGLALPLRRPFHYEEMVKCV